jgi:Cysteine rich repeat
MPRLDNLLRATARRLAVLVVAAAAWAGSSFAQQPNQAQINAIRQACRADYQTYCASVPTGGSAALACLKENAQSLSGPCQQAVGAVGNAAPAPQRQAPAAAPGMPAPAAPAYRSPPLPQGRQLSPRQEAYLLRRACGPDYRAFCSTVPVGGGRVIECLRENGPSLSRPCRSALQSAMRAR